MFEPVGFCVGVATWDLTADAVAQMGGELPVTFDPNPLIPILQDSMD